MHIYLITQEKELACSVERNIKSSSNSLVDFRVFSTVHTMELAVEIQVPDLVIWDHGIENRSVFDWLKVWKNKQIPFIITSKSAIHSFQAFEVDAFGFWLQPILQSDVAFTLNRFKKLHPQTQ